jgi:hypothetical protein
MGRAENVGRMMEVRNAHKHLVGEPAGKRQFGRPRRMWKDHIRTDLRETHREVVDWIHLVQDRSQWRAAVNKVMDLRVP